MPTMAKKRKPKFKPLTPETIREIREGLGFSIEEAAARVGVSPLTWKSWEYASQNRAPSKSHEILIRLLKRRVI